MVTRRVGTHVRKVAVHAHGLHVLAKALIFLRTIFAFFGFAANSRSVSLSGLADR